MKMVTLLIPHFPIPGARGIQGTLALYEPGVGLIYLDNVECAGNEEFLVNCSAPAVGDHNCNHFEDAGVLCEGMIQLASV